MAFAAFTGPLDPVGVHRDGISGRNQNVFVGREVLVQKHRILANCLFFSVANEGTQQNQCKAQVGQCESAAAPVSAQKAQPVVEVCERGKHAGDQQHGVHRLVKLESPRGQPAQYQRGHQRRKYAAHHRPWSRIPAQEGHGRHEQRHYDRDRNLDRVVVPEYVGRRSHGLAQQWNQAFGADEFVEHRNTRAEADLYGAKEQHQAANYQPEFTRRERLVGGVLGQGAPAGDE